MNLHVVGLAHTQTTTAYSVCAFTENARKFSKMMVERGHDVTLYAGQHDESGARLVTCITEKEQRKLGFTGPETILDVDYMDPGHWSLFIYHALRELRQRVEPDDFICVSMGSPTMERIFEAFPAQCVEYTAGYAGIDPRSRHVWPSHAWEHFVSGYRNLDGNGFDTVIPHPVETETSPFCEDPDDYFVWMGRPSRKGRHVAIQAARTTGARLLIAGPDSEGIDYGEYVGLVSPAERGKLLSHAKALFVPTEYIGPFELVFAEALMCGTPVITTDWGAFTEYVEQGVDGFRCRTITQFVDAMEKVERLDRSVIAGRAHDRFSPLVVAAQYEDYFDQLATFRRQGWL
jgi:glycosyltransferase involved in cell wall biosynthesis